MPKAEVGSTKYISNQMKMKGLGRLRWYCQICSKQCRDDNGFKQHTLSESHVRAAQQVGEDPRKYIAEFSRQFLRDFIQLLKTSHGEKKVHFNNFYQEYIRDKDHVHMSATKWNSLTELGKYLGQEGICRVEEGERGLEIAWVDDSAEAIRRREDVRKKDRLARGEEDVESRLLEEQVRRAREAEAEKRKEVEEAPAEKSEGDEDKPAEPMEPVKVSGFSLKSKAPVKPTTAEDEEPKEGVPVAIDTFSSTAEPTEAKPEAPAKMSLGALKRAKPVNPLAKKNPFAKPKAAAAPVPEKKMSNAERIMKEEIERKRLADERGYGNNKRQRTQ